MELSPTCRGALRAALAPTLTPRLWRRFIDHGGRPEWLARAPDPAVGTRLTRCLGVAQAEGAAIARRLAATDPDREWHATREIGATIDAWGGVSYPEAVRNLDDPPPVLWRLGMREQTDGDVYDTGRAVALVGSRAATPYGLRIARALAEGLTRAGVTIVATLDRGVGTAAHEGALRADGKSIAVLACGLKQAQGAGPAELQRDIAEAGLVVSEFPLRAGVERDHFLRRNQLVAALAPGVVVVEAHERSGALGTVRAALDLGRTVMAVPGPIDEPSARGPLRLLQEGAVPVGAVADVFTALGWCAIPKNRLPALEQDVLDAVERSPGAAAATAAAISDDLGLLEDQIAGVLFCLEARRLVRRESEGGFLMT